MLLLEIKKKKIAAVYSVSETSTHKTIRKCLEMYPYKIQIQQPLSCYYERKKTDICKWNA